MYTPENEQQVVEKFNRITEDTENSVTTIPTADVICPKRGYKRSYERRRGGSTCIRKKRRTPSFAGTCHLDRRENEDTGYKSQQPHQHTLELRSFDELRDKDPTSGSDHETISTRTNATHEQPSRGVWTHYQSKAQRTDRNRRKTMAFNSGDFLWSNQTE